MWNALSINLDSIINFQLIPQAVVRDRINQLQGSFKLTSVTVFVCQNIPFNGYWWHLRGFAGQFWIVESYYSQTAALLLLWDYSGWEWSMNAYITLLYTAINSHNPPLHRVVRAGQMFILWWENTMVSSFCLFGNKLAVDYYSFMKWRIVLGIYYCGLEIVLMNPLR